ncbi:MAG: ThiF family adenylyltransferase, partial [Alphaproteobacteria bacterium]
MNQTPSATSFRYDEAFSRNIGWVTEWEQKALKRKCVAIAGMGGVGGAHLLTLARLGIGKFRISDLDRFETANFNRQVGATAATIGQPKVDVLAAMARDINPDLEIAVFPEGVNDGNIDAFLEGADLFVDGFDFFVLDIRSKVFARCAELGIPAVTAAPLGMGAAYLVFTPEGMSFDRYFRLDGLSEERRYVNFFMGLAPKGLQGAYLMDPTRLDLAGRRGPSSVAGCMLCAGVVGAEAVKLLLGRGPVRPAPWYHHFDAYLGKMAVRRLPWGNANPIQRLRLAAAYERLAALSRNSWQAPARETGPEIEQILDLARWAPSGDNTQPWRFEIAGPDAVTVHIRDQADDDVYDYNDGHPSLLSAGILLETMRIAASRHGRLLWWTHRQSLGHDHVIDVELPKAPGVSADPLLPYIAMRSVNRRPFRAAPLTDVERAELERALGDEFEIRWYESWRDRWACARLNGKATDIRLRIPEAFHVHRRVIDWRNSRSPRGIPAGAIGLDAMTLRVMRWAMGDWRRMDRLNRLPGGTFAARMQLDYLPGLLCGAHFAIRRNTASNGGRERVPSLLRAGEALQRFWLTATRLGLALQPGMAAVIFGFYGRHAIEFTG